MVDGVDLATLDEDGLALFRRDRIGILFQSFHLIPTMTARRTWRCRSSSPGATRARRGRGALARWA